MHNYITIIEACNIHVAQSLLVSTYVLKQVVGNTFAVLCLLLVINFAVLIIPKNKQKLNTVIIV